MTSAGRNGTTLLVRPSDRIGTLTGARVEVTFATASPGRAMPRDAGGTRLGGTMASAFGGIGRPTDKERDAQRKQFVRLVLAGTDLQTSVRESRIQPLRALAILDELAALRVVTREPVERMAA